MRSEGAERGGDFGLRIADCGTERSEKIVSRRARPPRRVNCGRGGTERPRRSIRRLAKERGASYRGGPGAVEATEQARKAAATTEMRRCPGRDQSPKAVVFPHADAGKVLYYAAWS
jgi:hypothetical protein